MEHAAWPCRVDTSNYDSSIVSFGEGADDAVTGAFRQEKENGDDALGKARYRLWGDIV